MVLNVHKNHRCIRDGDWGGGMEVGEEGDYIPIPVWGSKSVNMVLNVHKNHTVYWGRGVSK